MVASKSVDSPVVVARGNVYLFTGVPRESVSVPSFHSYRAVSFRRHDDGCLFIDISPICTMLSFCADNQMLQKGDRFETSCYYDTALSSVDSDNVTFGFGSENEM